MKDTGSNINIAPVKGMPGVNVNPPKGAAPKINPQKPKAAAPLPSLDGKRPVKPLSPAGSPLKDDFATLKDAAAAVQRLRLSAQKELEQIRKMRADALRYQQETASQARSEAHQLILHARLTTQKEIEELIRESSEEIQKVLADIRVIRITAQEELAAQRKFTDAAKLSSMSISLKDELTKAEGKRKKQLVVTKS